MTPQEAADLFNAAPARLRRELRAAERRNVALALGEAQGLSEGTIPASLLAAMGHPYRHGGSPPQDPAIINKQTGLFRGSWVTRGPVEVGGTIASEVRNTAPQADFLAGGTRFMIPRPLPERVMERIGGQVERNREQAIERALTP